MLKIIRFTLAYLWLIPACILGCVYCLLRPFHKNNTTIAGMLIGLPAKVLFNIDIIFENPKEYFGIRNSLILSNHQDNLDLFLVGGRLPNQTVSIGKKQIRFIPFFGLVYWLSGNIFIDRSNRKKALESLNKAKEGMEKKDLNIWIMPEGTRSRGRGLLPFKKGPFYMAIETQAKITPVIVSSYGNLTLNKWKGGELRIKALDPIYVKDLDSITPGDLRDQIYDLMSRELKKLDNIVQK